MDISSHNGNYIIIGSFIYEPISSVLSLCGFTGKSLDQANILL